MAFGDAIAVLDQHFGNLQTLDRRPDQNFIARYQSAGRLERPFKAFLLGGHHRHAQPRRRRCGALGRGNNRSKPCQQNYA